MKPVIGNPPTPDSPSATDHLATAQQAQLAVEAVVRASAQVERRMGTAALVNFCEQDEYHVMLSGDAPATTLLRCLAGLAVHCSDRRVHVLLNSSSPTAQWELVDDHARRHNHVEVHRGLPGESPLVILNKLLPQLECDVVWLHPAAEFAPDLLKRLIRCRELNRDLAAVAPLCNRGDVLALHPLSALTTAHKDTLANVVAQCSSQLYPRVPGVHDACVLLTHDAFTRVGHFNPELPSPLAFVEWCQRAWLLGYECALCDDAFVLDQRKDAPTSSTVAPVTLQARFPDYMDVIRDLHWLDPLRIQRLRILERLRHRRSRPRLLVVGPQQQQAPHETVPLRGLAAHLRDEYNLTWLSTGDEGHDPDPRDLDPPESLTVRLPADLLDRRNTIRGSVLDLRSPRVEQWFSDALHGIGPDIVHFSGLRDLGSFLLPSIARAAGAHVVLSLNDYFLLCPNWLLTYADGRACRQDSCLSCGQTESCLNELRYTAPFARPLPLPAYLQERQRWARVALEAAHAIVVPSQTGRQALCTAFGDALDSRIVVLPAGALVAPPAATRSPKSETEGRLKLALLGPATAGGDYGLLQQALRTLGSLPVDWVVLDSRPQDLEPQANIHFTGPCQREDWGTHLQDVDAAVIAAQAPAVDTALVEDAFLLGLPVIATRGGAYSERVLEGETGLLFEPGCGMDLARVLRQFVEQRALRDHLRTKVCAVPIRTHGHALSALRRLYATMRQQHWTRSSSTLELMQAFRSRHKRAGAA